MIKQQNRNKAPVAAILFCLFVVMMGFGVLLPVLPFFVERLALRPGINHQTINFHIGALTAIYPFFQLIFAVIWGKLSDRVGRRSFIVMGLLGFILMQALIGLSTSFTMFYIARILGGILTAALIPVSNAYLSDITSKENRSKIMAWSGTAISTGIIAGPIAGGYLSKNDFHFSFKIGAFHLDKFSVPFFALIIPGIVALLIVLRTLKRKVNQTNIALSNAPALVVRSSGYSLLILLSLSFIYQFSVTSFETVFSIYAKNDLSFSAYQIGIGFMLCGLFMAVLQPVFASIKTKLVSDAGKLLTGFGIASFPLFILPFTKEYMLVYTLIILFAIGGALAAPHLTSLISLKDNNNTAKNLSVQTSVNSAGQIFGPLIGTWLADKQISAPFMVSSGLLAIPVLLFMRLKKKPNQDT